ncbi:hypothetical protein Syun_009001 [Stephania yunnanensis]|uniref:Fe2OG dioxygenase domain-containing protein n=1 Tax=Stephania yunnanensis TaxID=152371 RepID=A0AAP0KG62_9MAGN
MTAEYDRAQEVKAFDDTKAGVRGLVEDGITKLPQIFVTPPDRINEKKRSGECKDFVVPIIDLEVMICDMGRDAGRGRKEIINQVKDAAETWGFFQVVNHGIPMEVLDEMLKAVRMFHEQPKEERSKFYSRDVMRKVRYNCNFDLYNSEAANWRDTVGCIVDPGPLNQEELPLAFRNILMNYSKHASKLGNALFELLSEALGLGPSHLHDMGCSEGHLILGHYYPPCPEPQKTLGCSKHSDKDFLTILLQDQTGGLQVLHQGEWIDIIPIHGGLVINIGDLLQAIVTGIATRSIPSPRSQCIFDSLSEVFEILYYIGQGIPSVNRESRAAKAMWTGETFNAIFQETKSQVVNAIQMPQEQAIEIIKSVKGNLSNFGYYSISQELNMIIRFIRQRANRSMEEIHRDLEQLFVDMLNERLVQPAGIIVKEINESPPEELEKRLKEAIKVVSQIQRLEGLVQWSFLVGTTFTSMTTEASMLISNDQFKAQNEHRVVPNIINSRASMGSFFTTYHDSSTKTFGPIKELISQENPPFWFSQAMGKHSCVVSSSSDDSKFSSRIPLVGTYAAGISLVCLLLITLDKCAAFRNGKRWLPCRFLPLNSLTLTLVGIATILPVD